MSSNRSQFFYLSSHGGQFSFKSSPCIRLVAKTGKEEEIRTPTVSRPPLWLRIKRTTRWLGSRYPGCQMPRECTGNAQTLDSSGKPNADDKDTNVVDDDTLSVDTTCWRWRRSTFEEGVLLIMVKKTQQSSNQSLKKEKYQQLTMQKRWLLMTETRPSSTA